MSRPPLGSWLRAWTALIVLVLSAVLIALLTVGGGPLVAVDHEVWHLRLRAHTPGFGGLMLWVAGLGQRAPTAVPAVMVAGWLAWRRRSWRPMLLLLVGLGAVNLAVGVAKLGFGRVAPYTGHDGWFAGGIIFPSGHTANTVVTWGLTLFLLRRFRFPRLRGWTPPLVGGLLCAVGTASLYLDTHWLSDLVDGALVGTAIALAVIMLDAWTTRWSARAYRDESLLSPYEDEPAAQGRRGEPRDRADVPPRELVTVGAGERD